MKSRWLFRTGKAALLVCCAGWGMDEQPFGPLAASDLDVLLFYDYRRLELPADWQQITAQYQQVYLLGWSMGVWAGQQLFGPDPRLFRRAIALNGTLRPIDDRYGIPVEIYEATLNDFSEDIRQRFYRRMCRQQGVLAAFLARQPRRSLTSQREEMALLRAMVAEKPCGAPIYTDVLISDNDLIVPTQHQQAFWGLQQVRKLAGCHFPFAGWRQWDDILKLVEHG